MSFVVARVGHEIAERPPIRLERWQAVTISDRGSRWPEFVHVTAAHGTGWVPVRHLSVDPLDA